MTVADGLPKPPARRTERLAKWTRWRRRLSGVNLGVMPDFGARSNPCLAGRTLYAVSLSPGVVCALDAASGGIRWESPIGPLGGSSVLTTSRFVFANTAQKVFCLSRRTGEPRWVFCPYGQKGEWLYTSPVVAGACILMGDRRGRVHSVDAATGLRMWSVDTGRGEQVNANPAYDGRVAFFGTNGAEAVALDAKSGEIRWRVSLDGPCIAALWIMGPDVLVRTEHTLFRLRRVDGSVRGTWKPGLRIRAAIAAGDRLLAVVGEDPDSRLVVLRREKAIHEHPYPRFGGVEMLHFRPLMGLVYDCRVAGLGILDPRTGERLVEFTGLRGPIAHVDANRSSIFMLDGQGVVRAISHPPVKDVD